MDDDERKSHATRPSEIRAGHILAFTSYVRVERVEAGGSALEVRDLDHDRDPSPLRIEGVELIARAASADQFHEVRRVSKSRAAEILVGSERRPLTVAFVRQDGTDRTLRGRLVRPEPLLGRSLVEDLDADPDDRFRLVDHRTIRWLVVDGVRYEVRS